jgi:glutathione synthase
MDSILYSTYPPELTSENQHHLVSRVKNWTIHHGLAVRPSPAFIPEEFDPHGVLATNAPVTLFPSLFPKSCYERATSIQTTYNELYAAISRDESWVGKIIEE